MNFKLIIILLLIVLPFIVHAGEGRTFELDFKAKDQYNLLLKKSDRILFEYGGFNHTIIVDEIKNQTSELDIFFFLEKGLHTPDYQFLGKGYDLRLDFDKDGKKEMGIRLLNNDLTNGVTNILFEKLDAWDDEIILNPDFQTEENKVVNINSVPYAIGLVAIIIFISFILYIYNYNKKKNIYF
ncbi:hypothetical protein HYT56_02035 [Candidatus Woesearchaeota archaeon]|nr:hypothetical protein [Candidatus Woesearchaeota archaeon]